MKNFVFSADSHILEPASLYLDNMPASLKQHALHTRLEDDWLIMGTRVKDIYRLRLGKNGERKISAGDRKGVGEIKGRLEDMEIEGIDAEICFPQIGIWMFALDDPEAEMASCQIYNDWNHKFFGDNLNRFVRCGVLPVRDFANTTAELRRLAALGFTAAMLPGAMPEGVAKYNDEAWDPIFRLAGELGVVFVMHTGTGLQSVTSERGPGGAIINYSMQMNDAITSAQYLVAGGVLDRNPQAKVAFIESGASWLTALAERMDEVSVAHAPFVRPKLTRRPSQIIDDQVWASFQHDRACLLSTRLPGGRNVMWASDYPHNEGTFPHSRRITEELFDGIDVGEETKRDVLGYNAARLFRFDPVVATSAGGTG
jgi:predicted TIM-barrel fold metal-dependent hydrolase